MLERQFPFGCGNPNSCRTRLWSAFATGRSLSKERRTRFDFLVLRWLRLCFSRRSFPFPVTLKRFAAPLYVFILGIVLSYPYHYLLS
jgi:hypothetical protein